MALGESFGYLNYSASAVFRCRLFTIEYDRPSRYPESLKTDSSQNWSKSIWFKVENENNGRN